MNSSTSTPSLFVSSKESLQQDSHTAAEFAPDSGHPLFLHLRYYARHFIPVFCAIGIIGNCMALLLIRTNYWLKRLTSNIYLCTLSICGCLFLSTVMITWMDSTFGVPLYSNSEVGCKILTFVAHSCDFICVWMISWVSFDRCVVLFRPGIRRRICNKKFARNLTVATILFSSTLYGWCLVFAGLEPMPGTSDGVEVFYCGLNSEVHIAGFNLQELHLIFSLLDTALCTIFPSILIVVVNSLSIYRYRQCMKVYSAGLLRVRFLKVPETEVDEKLLGDDADDTCTGADQNTTRHEQQQHAAAELFIHQQRLSPPLLTTPAANHHHHAHNNNNNNNTLGVPATQKQQQQQRLSYGDAAAAVAAAGGGGGGVCLGGLAGSSSGSGNRQQQKVPTPAPGKSAAGGKLKSSDLTLSRSLLIVTSTFVLLLVPNYAFRLYEALFQVEPSHLWLFLYFTTFLLYYLHHAVLFYMYIFWSPQMKKQLVPTALKLFECYCLKSVPDFGHRSHLSTPPPPQLYFQPASQASGRAAVGGGLRIFGLRS